VLRRGGLCSFEEDRANNGDREYSLVIGSIGIMRLRIPLPVTRILIVHNREVCFAELRTQSTAEKLSSREN